MVPAATDIARVRVIGAMGGATFNGPNRSLRTTGGDGAQLTGTIEVHVPFDTTPATVTTA